MAASFALDKAPPDAEALAARHMGAVKPRDMRALHRWRSALWAASDSRDAALRALRADETHH